MYYWAIKKRKTSLIFAAVSLILIVSLGQAANAKEKNVKSSVRIEFSGGRTKTLSSPLRIKGKFKTENFVISHLSLEKIESLVLAKKQQGEKTFLLKLRGTNKAIRGSLTGEAEITGSGEWGKESIAISKIRSMHVTNVADAKPFEPESKWRCTFTSGEQLVIGWASKWSRDREFSGHIGGGSLNLAVQQVAKLTQNGGIWTVVSNDGFSLEGWQPKQKSFSTSSLFGGIELSWSKVAKLLNESVSAVDLGSKPRARHVPDWRVEIGGRFVLPVSEIQTGSKAKINDELNIKSLNWQFVDSAHPKPTGLQLQFSNKKSWMLQGTLSGNTPIGKVEASIEHITKLVRLTPPPKNRIPSEYSKRIIGRIKTNNGTEYPVAAPTLVGGSRVHDDDDYWGYNLFIIQATPVESWVESAVILSHTLNIKDKKVVSDNPMLKRYGPLEGFKGVTFINPAGNFTLPLAEFAEYVPHASPPSTAKLTLAKYRITVRDAKDNKFKAELTTIQFARYPKYGWSGAYTKWAYPFQWHRASELFFKKESGERIDVQFDKLSRIEITDSYNLNRNATLSNKQGSVIKGSIYPGDVSRSHGVSTWNPYKEGLLCKTIDGMYLFVRFNNVKTIEIALMPSN